MKNKKLEEFIALEQQVKLGGSEKSVENQHAKGKLTSDERLDVLFDNGTFIELDMFAQHQCH